MDNLKDAEIARLKALCKQYKLEAAAEKRDQDYKIVEKCSSNLGDTLYILLSVLRD